MMECEASRSRFDGWRDKGSPSKLVLKKAAAISCRRSNVSTARNRNGVRSCSGWTAAESGLVYSPGPQGVGAVGVGGAVSR